MRIALWSLIACAWATVASAQDTKQTADFIMRVLMDRHFDGTSYGDPITTCRVLDAMRRSPRHYNELDGPFFRRAAEHISAHPDVPAAWRILALSNSITSRLRYAYERAADAFAEGPDGGHYPRLLAWRTLYPSEPFPGKLVFNESLAVSLLLADDPGSVPAPPLSESRRWARWARAARMRGITPTDLPPVPSPSPDADLYELLDDLDLVIALHGLERPGDDAPQPEQIGLPPRVAPGGSLDDTLTLALAYLSSIQDGGTFGLELPGWDGAEAGVTALCLSATMQLSDRLDRERPPWIETGLDYLLALQHDDGSIHDLGLAVYTTSVAIQALLDGGRPADAEAIERAREFLLLAQADEGEGYSPESDPHYGGIGYGGDNRPDLSNTYFAIEAAHRAGTPSSDAFYSKAMEFLVRNQNDAESTRAEWPRAKGGVTVTGVDGGATYMPGSSPAGEQNVSDGVYVARSYGSMTYALTRSYLLCGLGFDDGRMQAALRWLGANYTLQHNPGFADAADSAQGLYYYYMAMARTLAAVPTEHFVDADGQPIPWRADLEQYLRLDQRTTGSWINDRASRWWERSPSLCTAYAVLALSAAATP